MNSHYRVVVIGGGVVGTSVLYHLAKFGWSDVCLIERSVLTAGSSWHAAGGFHALNADPNIASLQAYTIDLLSTIEQESGRSVGMHMTGMDRWIDWQKSDFIGRQAALDEHQGDGPAQVLVTLEVDASDADASGYELVWRDGQRVGFVTSGGYGHALGKSLAMALVDRKCTEPGTKLRLHVVGVEKKATVIPPSPYDPTGIRMRN